jgi:hypothetical protein
MCCFSGKVEFVGATKIFVRAVDALHQALVYEMKVAAAAPVAMVLPIPVPKASRDDAVRFVDLSAYDDFFRDVERAFPPPPASGPIAGAVPFGAPRQMLQVHQVGKFEASFVPTIADFTRLDPRFRMPAAVFDRLPAYRDFGFAVFQLRDVRTTPDRVHPMAFVFPRRDPSLLFFPTVHVHDGVVHEMAHFDHSLYMQLDEAPNPPEFTFAPNPNDPLRPHGWWPSVGVAANSIDIARTKGLVEGSWPLRTQKLVGTFLNQDVLFPLSATPPRL